MVRPSRAALVACLLFPLWASPAAGADSWFGRDKALHFGASFGLALVGYVGASLVFEERAGRVTLGAAFALSGGIAKELADHRFHGDPSFRDLAWDALGTAAGTLVAWTIDRRLLACRPSVPLAALEDGPFAGVGTSAGPRE